MEKIDEKYTYKVTLTRTYPKNSTTENFGDQREYPTYKEAREKYDSHLLNEVTFRGAINGKSVISVISTWNNKKVKNIILTANHK
jgi:hypothetical protein